MKKLILITLLAFGMAFTYSCEKEDAAGNTGVPSTPQYEVDFACQSDNPYYLWVDDVNMGVVPGQSYITITLLEGPHTWNVEQKSGYALYPTKQNGSFDLQSDGIVTFP